MKSAESLITELYMNEDLMQGRQVKITVKISAEDAAMFTCIANRFGVNRFDLIQPLLSEGAGYMFQSLSPEDRERIAELADAEAQRLLEKEGVTAYNWETGENVPITCSNWKQTAKHLAQAEKQDKDKGAKK
ncbi:hypothetical protein [Shewanella algae]|uniref:hypothetical protein n=1 Tax=Shewanella algae TaxID=38313 RepID=UPI001AAE0CBF|nr:hypothetical protein [Shewanella algae]MBO2601491.1 hypothetical protein [Shewanella algae]